MSYFVATTGSTGPIIYYTGISTRVTGSIFVSGYPCTRWTESTIQQCIKEAQEYIAHLKDSRDRLKAIIG